MSEVKMNALIVRHLADVDAAMRQIHYHLEPQIEKALNETAESWAKKNGWSGDFKWFSDNLLIAPRDWMKSDAGAKPSWYSWFYLYAGQGDDFDDNDQVDYNWLTRLCGVGRGELGFRWDYERGEVAPKGKKWKQFVRPYIERVIETGFSYEEETGLFFLPVRIDNQVLAQALENETLEDALRPFEQALDRCLAAKSAFDELLDAAKAQFAQSE